MIIFIIVKIFYSKLYYLFNLNIVSYDNLVGIRFTQPAVMALSQKHENNMPSKSLILLIQIRKSIALDKWANKYI